MKLTPLEIRKQQFKKVMRGYDPVEVDTFIELAATDFEEALKQQKEMREKEIALETQLVDYKSIEKSLQQTLLQAQEVSGKATEAARREADGIVRDAEARAAAIVENATREFTRLNNDVAELKIRRDSLIARLRVLLSAELELLKTLDETAVRSVDPPPSLGTGKDKLDVDSIVTALDHDRTPQAN
jgi:cell division initiation protein